MSIGGAFKSEKTKTSQKSQSDPWDITIPALEDLVVKVGGLVGQTPGVTPDQQTAFDELKGNAATAGRYAPDINALAGDLFGTQSNSGMVNDEFADFKRRLTPTAEGTNQDIMNDPRLAQMLQQVGDDVATRVNSSFAAGGRTGSGANQTSVSRGITQAQLPILINQLNAEKARSDAATRDLFAGGNTAASAITALDNNAADQRIKGIDVGNAGIAAENAPATTVLNLEEQMKNLPADWYAKLASILFPAGQLGQQQTGSGTSKSTGFNLGGSVKVMR